VRFAMKAIWTPVLLFITALALTTKADAQILMRGDIDYFLSGRHIRVEIDDITNFNETPTDRLRLRVYAVEEDDNWSVSRPGRPIAVRALPSLDANENRSHIRRTDHIRIPSTGWYYIVIALEERATDEFGQKIWEIRDAVEFDDLHFFRRPWDFWPF
jgi:hypothetical protein